MRTTTIRTLTCCLLAICGWLAGRQMGAPQGAALPLQAKEAPVASTPASASGSVDSSAEETLSASDFHAAVAAFSKDRVEIAAFADFVRLAERLPLAAFPEALAKLSKSNWQARLLELWAVRNPGAAKAWFEAQPEADRIRLFPEWASTWARVDATGLRQWLASRSDGERGHLLKGSERSWVDALAKEDPIGAFQLAQSFPQLINAPAVLQVWAARDPVAAATAALELPSDQRSTAANFIMRQ